jgi:autotransporter-associated beta strand protein
MKLRRAADPTAVKPRLIRPVPCATGIELLENRIAPAVHTWIGPASGGMWSNAANWNGGVPITGEAGGTIVQFNGNVSSTDNIAGLVVDQIHFTAGGNTILGNGGNLGLSGSVLTNNLLNDAGSNLIDSTLTLVNSGAATFILVTAGTLTMKCNITGTQGVTLVEGSASGTLAFTGQANSYTGSTTVTEGTLVLNSPGANTAIPGTLNIGNNVGAGQSAVVKFLQGNEIANNATVNVASDGLLDLNGSNDFIGALNLQSGTNSGAVVKTTGPVNGLGTLTLGGDVTLTNSGTGAVGATISGKLDLGNATRMFSIPNGAAASELKITAQITGTGGIIKTGTGGLEFAADTAANNYTGDTTVQDGVLVLSSNVTDGAVPNALVIGDDVGAGASALVQLIASNQITDASVVVINTDGRLLLSGVNDTTNALALDTGTNSAGSIVTGTGKLTLGGDLFVLPTGTGAVGATISGNLDFGSFLHAIFVGDGAASSDLLVTANILGSAGYNKTSAGTMEVQGTGPTGLVKVSAGTLLLNGGSTDAIIGGLLEIGTDTAIPATVRLLHDTQIANTSIVTVRTDGTLDLNGFNEIIGGLSLASGTAAASSVTTGTATLTLTGTTDVQPIGTGATPATIAGNVDFNGNIINVGDGAASSDFVVLAKIAGNTGYIKGAGFLGAGTMELKNSGPTGPVAVYGGTLLLNSNGFSDAIQGPLTIGLSNVINTASVKFAQSTEIADNVTITIAGTGTLNLNNFHDVIGGLVLEEGSQSGAQVVMGAGFLQINGDVTTTVAGTGAAGANISGVLTLGPGAHIFTIANGAAASDLTIGASINGPGGITKAGAGRLEIINSPSDNTYTGATRIHDGVAFYTSVASADSTSDQIIIGDGIGGPASAILRLGQLNVIQDTAAITVMADGLLDLNGEIDNFGALTVQAFGALNLGSGTAGTGDFVLASGSTFAALPSGTLNVTGTVTLGGKLLEIYNLLVPVGTTATIIANDGNDAVNGTFAGLPQGTVFGTAAGLFQISYTGGDGNDVTLTAVDSSAVVAIAATGKSATFTDVDGDLVTVKTSQGILTKDNFLFGSIGSGLINGYQLQALLLSDAQFDGATVTVTAKPTALGGNGHVNIGSLNAFGRDLAAVTIPGDVSLVQAGDNDAKKPGLGKLVVDSLGELGSVTQRLFAAQYAIINDIGSLTVKGNIRGTNLALGKTGTVTVGGSLFSSDVTLAGNIDVTSAKKITIAGSVVAAPGTVAGRISAIGDLGKVSIGLDLVGATKIVSGGKLGPVVIKGEVRGESAAKPALISGAGSAAAPKSGPDTAITSLTIGKSAENLVVKAGYTAAGAAFSADAAIGKISIGGDLRASSILVGVDAGADGLFGTADDKTLTVMRDDAKRFATIASLIVKGQAIGTIGSVSTTDFFAIIAEQIIAAKIGGVALKLKAGPRSATDTFALGFASAGPGGLPSDLYLHEISA